MAFDFEFEFEELWIANGVYVSGCAYLKVTPKGFEVTCINTGLGGRYTNILDNSGEIFRKTAFALTCMEPEKSKLPEAYAKYQEQEAEAFEEGYRYAS